MHINTLNNNSLEAILSNALKDSAATTATLTNSSLTASGTSATTASDNSQLSLFAQLINMLQELQQSNSTEYQSVTQKIAAELKAASETAQADGNKTEASQLSQVSTDFVNASTSGQLPDLQDLFQSLDGTTASAKANGSLSQLEQLLASFQTGATSQNQSSSLSIILNTLSSSVKNG